MVKPMEEKSRLFLPSKSTLCEHGLGASRGGPLLPRSAIDSSLGWIEGVEAGEGVPGLSPFWRSFIAITRRATESAWQQAPRDSGEDTGLRASAEALIQRWQRAVV